MSEQPTDAEYAERVAGAGGRRRTVRRTQGLLALAASVAVVAGGLVGLNRLPSDDAPGSSSDAASNASASSASVVVGSLDVSGSGVGTQPFGTDAADVLAAVAARFGEPDLTVGPRRYFRLPDSDAWYEAADDPLSPSWQYPITSLPHTAAHIDHPRHTAACRSAAARLRRFAAGEPGHDGAGRRLGRVGEVPLTRETPAGDTVEHPGPRGVPDGHGRPFCAAYDGARVGGVETLPAVAEPDSRAGQAYVA